MCGFAVYTELAAAVTLLVNIRYIDHFIGCLEIVEFHIGHRAGSSGVGRITFEVLIGPANGLLGERGLPPI